MRTRFVKVFLSRGNLVPERNLMSAGDLIPRRMRYACCAGRYFNFAKEIA